MMAAHRTSGARSGADAAAARFMAAAVLSQACAMWWMRLLCVSPNVGHLDCDRLRSSNSSRRHPAPACQFRSARSPPPVSGFVAHSVEAKGRVEARTAKSIRRHSEQVRGGRPCSDGGQIEPSFGLQCAARVCAQILVRSLSLSQRGLACPGLARCRRKIPKHSADLAGSSNA